VWENSKHWFGSSAVDMDFLETVSCQLPI